MVEEKTSRTTKKDVPIKGGSADSLEAEAKETRVQQQNSETHQESAHKTEQKQEEQKRPRIPVLRTFEHDTSEIIKDKGGSELRTMVVHEREEKRREKKEFQKEVREMNKEALILRNKQNEIAQTTRKTEIQEQVADRQLQHVVEGATEYFQNIAREARKEKESVEQKQEPQETSPQKELPQEQPTPQEQSVPQKQHDGEVAEEQRQVVREEVVQQTEPPEIKKGFLAKVRGRISPEEAFSKEQRELMQAQQEEVTKKKEVEDAWKQFQNKKENLREKGFMLRDVRSHNPFPEKNKKLRKQNFIAIGSIAIISIGLIVLIYSIVTRSTDTVGYIPPSDLRPTQDVVTSEKRTTVNVVDNKEGWEAITTQGGNPFTVTKFVPFEERETGSVQLSLGGLFDVFAVAIPAGFFDTLNSYYFIGNYRTEEELSSILILSVENYGDALVWMLNWEKYAINGLVNLFPNTLKTTNPENTTVEKKVIDNQDVRILKNQLSETAVSYYFFNRSVLVIIVGDEGIIPQINKRIIAANAR